VRTGEKAIRIIAPLPIKSREQQADGEGEPENRLLFKAVAVFDRSQVAALEGVEPTSLEAPCEPLTGDSHMHLLAPLQTFTESLGFTVSFEVIAGLTGGWCDQKAKRIVVDAHQPPNARLRILIPELAHALRKMPVAERDALLLVPWGELSYEETATALDVPVGMIRSRIFRARQRLAAALGARGSVTSSEYRLPGEADA
jgi:predicted DNA-binding protein (UPF0251 family)